MGHPDVQANFIQPPNNGYYRAEFDFAWVPVNGEQVKSPANMVVDAAQGVRFERCAFTALGGCVKGNAGPATPGRCCENWCNGAGWVTRPWRRRL